MVLIKLGQYYINPEHIIAIDTDCITLTGQDCYLVCTASDQLDIEVRKDTLAGKRLEELIDKAVIKDESA